MRGKFSGLFLEHMEDEIIRLKIATDAIDLVGAIARDIKALTPSLLKTGYFQGETNAAHRQLTERYLKPKK